MPEKKGIVFVVDGAGGSGFLPFVMKGILADTQYDMHHFRWSAGYMRIIKDLTNRENNRKRASDLGRAITQHRSKQPGDEIHLVAKSAGTAIALWAMSELEDNALDRVILLAPAVSPGFPLESALHAARRDVYSFWSPHDLFYLGLGTSLFGTADGARGKSAGLIGFTQPKTLVESRDLTDSTDSTDCDSTDSKDSGSRDKGSGDTALSSRAKLREIKWDPSMIASLHIGDHLGTSMPPFIRKYVLPLLASN